MAIIVIMERNSQDTLVSQCKRRKPQQKRSVEKLNRILDAATILVATQENQKLTTSMIAKRAGVSVGSIYQFYSNVDEIKEALLTRVLRQITMVHEETIRGMPDDATASELVTALIDTIAKFYHDYPMIVKVITASVKSRDFLGVKEGFAKSNQELLITEIMRRGNFNDLERTKRWLETLILISDTMTIRLWSAETQRDRDRFTREWKAVANHYIEYQSSERNH